MALLNGVLALEQRSVAAYTAAGPLLRGADGKVVEQFLAQELQHTGYVRKLVKRLHGHPHDPLPHYDLGQPQGRADLLALLHGAERDLLAGYLRAIPRASEPALRQAMAAILANHAQHVTVLRAQQHMPLLTAPLLAPGE